ncbi:transposase [Ancylomarina sp. YFZ004]
MVDKFQNKYRIPSARLKDWDYGSNAIYFVTPCTQHREYYFGEIVDGKMILNEIGKLAQNFWMTIPNHFPFVKLHAFVIMPNHMHGIIEINKLETTKLGVWNNTNITGSNNVMAPNLENDCTNTDNNTKTPKLDISTNKHWKPGVLGVIINQYKRICTLNARKINPQFAWQTRFHDHIVRDFDEYHRIEHYIQNNPRKWKKDVFYSK